MIGEGEPVINQELYDVVRQLCHEIVEGFETEGIDLNSATFLSDFSYTFVGHDYPVRRQRVLAAALAPAYRGVAEKAVEAAYSDSMGGTTDHNLCNMVDDFLNYVVPRVAGLPDRDVVFDQFYRYFDASLYGKGCIVTMFAILHDVWDNGLRAVLPPGYALRYFDRPHLGSAADRRTRDRSVPYFEILESASPVGIGRAIRDKSAYFVFSYSTTLPKDKELIPAAYKLRDEMTRKFIFSVRVLKSSSAFSEYRGFRMLGHLSRFGMNLMNFPEDFLDGGRPRELQEHDGHQLRRLLPKLAGENYGFISILDTKLEDALRRKRVGSAGVKSLELRVAIDQLIDYFQILEAIVPTMGSEFIALYSAVLLTAIEKGEGSWATFQFIKRMHKFRNDVMHGRLDDVLNPKANFSVEDVERFKLMIHALAGAYAMNGPLREIATKLALGHSVELTSLFPSSVEEMNRMRRPQNHPPTWW
jgi:hypothetical protein